MKSSRVKCSASRPYRPLRLFDLEAVDEVSDIVEAATRIGSDAASGNGGGQMDLAGTRSTDRDDVALLSDDAAAGEIVDERLIVFSTNVLSNKRESLTIILSKHLAQISAWRVGVEVAGTSPQGGRSRVGR
jgi:hypothetical protein